MNVMKRNSSVILFLIVLSTILIVSYFKLNTSGNLRFSDGAKFADIARNLISGKGYGINFSFFTNPENSLLKTGAFSAKWVPPLMPLAIAGSFLIFGVSDFAVIFTSGLFYVGAVIILYLIGKKLFGSSAGKLIGVLSALSFSFNVNFLDYATSGASETLFAFLILLPIYLFIQRSKITDYLGFLSLVVLYFSRPHAPIYIVGIWFFYLLLRSKNSKMFIRSLGYSLIAGVFIEIILRKFSGQFFLQSITARGAIATYDYSSLSEGNTAIRGGLNWEEVSPLANVKAIATKTFYNLYNFYRLLPQIASPYMWGLFVIGLFHWSKSKAENSLKIATLFMVIVTFLVAALTIPFFRYLHPVVPLVYLFAVSTLVWIVRSMVNGQWLMVKKWPLVEKLSKEKFIILSSSFLILFFVGQTLGVIFLDSRFEADRTNGDKPPVYVQLSHVLRDNTSPEDIIITNLDTWGSWYGERRTIWFPLEPNQLRGLKKEIDAIYLTNYLIDDENYYMGNDWRQILNNPKNPANEFVAENYELKGEYRVKAEDTYENQEARAILYVKKEN